MIFNSACRVWQVTEYLKEVMVQEQKKKETQGSEPAGSPRVGVVFLCWEHTRAHSRALWQAVSGRLSENPPLHFNGFIATFFSLVPDFDHWTVPTLNPFNASLIWTAQQAQSTFIDIRWTNRGAQVFPPFIVEFCRYADYRWSSGDSDLGSPMPAVHISYIRRSLTAILMLSEISEIAFYPNLSFLTYGKCAMKQ